jgi:hypothetical protein
MSPTISPVLQDRDLLEFLSRNIERCDGLRDAVASRAGAVLGTNALVLGAVAIFLPQILGGTGGFSRGAKITVGALVCVTLIFVCASVVESIRALVNPYAWGTRPSEFAIPSSPVFNHSDTVKRFSSSADFSTFVLGVDVSQLVGFAANELWIVIRSHHLRYGRLLKSTRALFAALVSLLLTTLATVSFFAVS